MKEGSLPYAEFYITNICNFNCSGCNRFNNYNFSGFQRWEDFKDIYARWADRLDLGRWGILGGEPFINPTYIDWLDGISDLWPGVPGSLITNGYYLSNADDRLYEVFRRKPHLRLDIGLHNISRRDSVLSDVKNWLHGNIEVSRIPDNIAKLPRMIQRWKESYNKIKDVSWPECVHPDDWASLPAHIRNECELLHNFSPEIIAEERLEFKLVDSNGVTVTIFHENFFHQGAIIHNKNGSITLHNSDPEKAHSICHSKNCHHFMDGYLYKCGAAALFPEFDKQFELTLSDSRRELINKYLPLSVDSSNEVFYNFISNLENHIPQCTCCPDEYCIQEIHADTNKVKLRKKK
jgi:organic radical activating enzyme